MSKNENEGRINSHYSIKTGHVLRGEHQRVVKELGGHMPESLPGYSGIENFRKRRYVRRITKSGLK